MPDKPPKPTTPPLRSRRIVSREATRDSTPRQLSTLTIRSSGPVLADGTIVESPDLHPEAFDRITAEEFRELSSSDQVQYMVDWFGRRYEDPAINLSYDGREGGYQWFDGPYTAQDVLQERFLSLAALETIQSAVEQIEESGVEWARISTDRDDDRYYDSDSASPVEPEFIDPDEATLRARTIASLDEVEKLIEDVIAASRIGHNNPPEPIETPPVSRQEFDSLRADLDRLRDETAKTSPDAQVITDSASKIRKLATKVGSYLGQRITNVVDDPGKLVVWTVVWSSLASALSNLARDALAWAQWIISAI